MQVECQAVHAEAPGNADDLQADAPGADHSECLATQLHAAQPLGGPFPPSAGLKAMAKLAGHSENEREGVLRHRGRTVVRHACQNHPALPGCGQIEVIHRGGSGGDKRDPGMRPEECGVDRRVDEHGNNLRIGGDLLDGVHEFHLVALEAPDEKWLLVVLGFNENNFHVGFPRNAFAPAATNECNPRHA